LSGVEHDHPERAVVLAGQQVADDRLPVGLVLISLALGWAETAEVIHDEIDVALVAERHDRRG
jgi:hypothetical protein